MPEDFLKSTEDFHNSPEDILKLPESFCVVIGRKQRISCSFRKVLICLLLFRRFVKIPRKFREVAALINRFLGVGDLGTKAIVFI